MMSYYMTVYHVLIFDIFILVSLFNSPSIDLIVGHAVASSVDIDVLSDVPVSHGHYKNNIFLFVYC